ncbi:uncharacterized protein LOC119726160 isoform X2 [Patiria miniata]|uniref:Uncharacterized protein n=1 Tax=Patiria miniata TaxID=46514 RepID=A0A913ZRC2_PATMI|nr:uncharacterized protein LOC119726160 isoform X2 [Patiria miniata]XP_038053701.1 uncharacterized protein LOC119726160 isoform X2 [Patiria miniata]XP_038053702.1 uncharacterized protein LOC119726160 isoform X2 [Patiria miniata]
MLRLGRATPTSTHHRLMNRPGKWTDDCSDCRYRCLVLLIIVIILITLVIRKVKGKRTRSQSSYQMTIPPPHPPNQCSQDRPGNASDENCFTAVGGATVESTISTSAGFDLSGGPLAKCQLNCRRTS